MLDWGLFKVKVLKSTLLQLNLRIQFFLQRIYGFGSRPMIS
jgi:hypothetical protein